jgi:diaminohydroxyphosphoribosylaminopyrimidine deaminase / 5-amino-6-(5-phosphoribosylamino)uracil reductase
MVDDAHWMGLALCMAARGLGRTGESPAVGCVIVKDGLLVGRGETKPGGRPHAEYVALQQAGAAARGATLYVTLEPCAHPSPRGPTCARLIPEFGITRVVCALIDPDPRTQGQGIALLKQEGIAITLGVEEGDARALLAGWLKRLATGKPQVSVKLATSADGAMALANGQSRWITGVEAREHGHSLRARHDAILVGSATVEADDPGLDVRLPGLEAFSPRPLIWSQRWQHIPSAYKLANRPDALVLNEASVPDLLARIGALGINHLLVEAGPKIITSMLQADAVDTLYWYRAPLVLGGRGAALGDLGFDTLARLHKQWQITEQITLGVDHLSVYQRQR